VISDANGGFSLENIAPGTYALIAQRPGYSSQKYGAAAPLARNCSSMDDSSYQFQHAVGGEDAVSVFRQCIERAPGTMLAVTADLEMKDLVIQIAQLGVISGKVTDQDYEAVPGQVVAMVHQPGARSLRVESTAAIGPDGEYTVDDLLPGRYYLLARNTSAQALLAYQDRQSKPPLEADVSTFYPSALDESKAVPVDVKAGEELRGADILVRRARVFSVRGAIAMPPGTPAASMAATMTPKEGATDFYSTNRAMAGANGAFEFHNVAPGAYVVSCRTQALFGRLETVVSAADVEGANVTMVPGIAVAGTVKVEGASSGTWPTVTLAAVDGSFTGSIRPDSKGAFTAPTAIAPLEYAVRVAPLPSGTYVKSIRYGAQDALHGPLDLTGSASGSLEIILSSKAAAIAGKVTDAPGDAVKGVVVTAWPRKPEFAGGVHAASTDQNGNFEIAGLGPGDYFVAAWEDLEPVLAESPDFLNRFQNTAAAATLEEGGRASADVKLIPREKIDSEIAKLP
jgi:hypothetical protein